MSITLRLHPDWPHGDGLVTEAMALDGGHHSQFVTGVSNGLLAPVEGSDRWLWKSRLFGGRYDDGPVAARPVYGSFDRGSDPCGGSPRFGSAYLRLRPDVADRATYCYLDSTLDPSDFGGPEVLELLCLPADAAEVLDPRDDYVEAQVHDGVRFDRDVEAPSRLPGGHCRPDGRPGSEAGRDVPNVCAVPGRSDSTDAR